MGLAFAVACSPARPVHAQPVQRLFHVTHDTYGCANPRATMALANQADPRRSDPGWVAFVVNDGHCAPITPRSPWRLVSRAGELSYMAYAGTTGLPGSFYVKADELVEMDAPPSAQLPPPQVAAAAPSTQAPPSSPPRDADIEPPAVTTPQPATRPTQRGDRTQARPPVANGYIDAPEARLPQARPVQLPAVDLPSSEASQQSGSSGSGAPGFVIVAFLVGGFILLMRVFRKQPAPRTRRTPEMAGAPDGGARPSVSARAAGPAPAKAPTLVVWHPKNSAVTVAGHGIGAGMIYVGTHEPSDPGGSPCFIDPALEVARSNPDTAGAAMPYWPSYSRIQPRCRLAYLKWLASGRSDPSVGIGYVFLFFYGLERRLFVTGANAAGEIDAIAAEVERLLRIYGANRSFAGYARGMIEAIATKRLLDGSGGATFMPDLDAPAHAMPLPLQVAIADRVSRREPLAFAFAVAGALGQPAETMPVDARVLNHARPQLLEILKPRFEAACPLGLRLEPGKGTALRLPYRGATAGLQVDLAASARRLLPDPAGLAWTGMTKLVAAAAAELEPFAKRAAHRPQWTGSLEAVSLLPREARGTAAAGPAFVASTWLRDLPRPLARVAFPDLARHVLGEDGATLTPRRHEKVHDALAALDFGLEPLPGNVPAGADRAPLVLFPDPDAATPRSTAYAAAAVGAELVSTLFAADPAGRAEAEKTWLAAISKHLPVTPSERLRLTARLRWSQGSTASAGRIRKGLMNASLEERAIVAAAAAAAAAAGGTAARDHVKLLERVYDELELKRSDLYSALHGATAQAPAAPARAEAAPTARPQDVASDQAGRPASAGEPGLAGTTSLPHLHERPGAPADEPILVSSGTAETVYVIPPPPPQKPAEAVSLPSHAGDDRADGLVTAAAPEAAPSEHTERSARGKPPSGGAVPLAEAGGLDEERLRRLRAETEKIGSLLADVFADDEAPTPPPSVTPAPGGLLGLDAIHSTLVRALARSPTWSRADFEREAGACGLLPDGALEMVNEWAYDAYGEPLIEDGDPVTVNLDLLPPEEIADAA